MYKVRAVVKDVNGLCHAGFKKGDKITFERPRIVLQETDRICMFALQSLLPFVAAKCSEITPSYSKSKYHKNTDSMLRITQLRCPDPGPECSSAGGAGTVIFEIVRETIEPSEDSD